MTLRKILTYVVFSLTFFFSCEKDISIKPDPGIEQLVVEGHIEPGFPPYVILTRSQPYFSSVSYEEINKIFVHNAVVTIHNGSDTTRLVELSSDSIPSYIAALISGQLGVQIAGKGDKVGLVVSVYLGVSSPLIIGEVGREYVLEVESGTQHLKAITTIPKKPVLDSVWATPHPTSDTLVTLNVRYPDPAGERNFIRYFTSTNYGPFYSPYFQSVLDDKSIFDVDGKTFDFPIQKGHSRVKAINFQTFTYFTKGDSVIIKWCAIDEAHFNFWNTAEYDRSSTGNPFAAPTTIKSNIQGGIGIWGGYSPVYYSYYIPK